ncbi:MAG TPA: NnrS family protein [Candidatus Koribacter sp.]|jgi:hypothetical protein
MPELVSITDQSATHRSARRERNLSRLLVAFIGAGLAFMLLPGTFLGVWNLFAISSRHSSQAISAEWIQAHGHAQVFGWIGCFILGIGFHSIPKMRGAGSRIALGQAAFSLSAWVSGVFLRWFANVYFWHWRALLPLSAALELIAFLFFFRAVSQHKSSSETKAKFEAWIFVVIAGTLGWLAALVANFYECVHAALQSNSPAFPAAFDQRFLVVLAWAFLVPHVWGFSAKWLPIFLGLKIVRTRLLLSAVVVNIAGVVLACCGLAIAGTLTLLAGALVAGAALRIFERGERPAKTTGVHASFPVFIRVAYTWLLIAATLGTWAAFSTDTIGIAGASRHALTVGFVSLMVFNIGQRVLPAFSGMKLLWSPRVMFASSALLTIGCTLRVASEVLAYQGFSSSAWHFLPASAVIEMSAVTLCATNLVLTFMQSPAHEIRLRESAVTARAAVS